MKSVNYTEVNGSDDTHDITVYSLTTCPHCTNVKKYLKEKGFSYKYLNVDESSHDEKREVTLLLKANHLPIAFPLIIIDDNVIQGFNQKLIDKHLKEHD